MAKERVVRNGVSFGTPFLSLFSDEITPSTQRTRCGEVIFGRLIRATHLGGDSREASEANLLGLGCN
jgi:hypothetical protein